MHVAANSVSTIALICRKDGFDTLRPSYMEGITAELLKEVSDDVNVEPQLQQ